MKVDIEALDFAKVIFRARNKLASSEGYHAPDKRCPNCEVHETCGNLSEFLIPWEELSAEKRSAIVDLAQAILWELEALEP